MAVKRVVMACLPTVVAGFMLQTICMLSSPMNSWLSS